MSYLTRREMLQTSAAVLAAGVWSQSQAKAADSPNEKLNLAVVGLGGQGSANLGAAAKQNVVALCDVDDQRAGAAYEKHPKAKKFYDFRQMLDEMEKQIDGVVISTPDHTHFHPAWWSIERGKHVYVEKPLCHSVWETRKLTEFARQKKVATQLGAQRHALQGLRDGVEIVKSGVLGDITEVHAWVGGSRGFPEKPKGPETIPSHLKWDLWLGPAKNRDYQSDYVPYKWRFWWDFGTGESGNWGCHILDIPFWALDLKYPSKVSPLAGGTWDADRTPKSMGTRFDFPAAGKRGPVALFWYHGTPPILKEKNIDAKGANNVFIGREGMLLAGFGKPTLLPAEKFAGYKVPSTLGKSPGFHQEWFAACKGGAAASCNFDYTGPLTETVLLGNVAFRAKAPFDWNGDTMTPSGNDQVEQYLKSHVRKGWEV